MDNTNTMYDKETHISNNVVAISNQEITSKKWKFDSILKILAGIIYGFFFGMLPANFNFGKQRPATDPSIIEITSIVGLLFIGIFSLVIIFWLYRGDIKKRHPISYTITHLVNSILLSAGILVAVILYPNYDDVNKYFIIAISSIAWFLVISIYLFFVLGSYRKQFPLTWSKIWFAITSMLFAALIEVLIYIHSSNIIMNDFLISNSFFLFIALISLLISICIFGFGISYVKRYRDVLLGERTDNEIDNIKDWESARVSSIIIASTISVVYAISLIWTNALKNISLSTPMYLEIALDIILLVPYMILISIVRWNNFRNSKKGFLISKTFKTIDNGLLIDTLAWIIVLKSVLIQGVFLSTPNILGWNASIDDKSLMLILTFGTLVILYSFSVFIQINSPNLRNTWISIFTISFAIILILFIILFSGYIQSRDSISIYVFVLISLFMLIGMSISLIIKISMVSMIFKSKWTQTLSENTEKSYLVLEERNEINGFLNLNPSFNENDLSKQTSEEEELLTFNKNDETKEQELESLKG